MTTELRDQLQSTLGSAYALERELTSGGMNRLFLATQCSLQHTGVMGAAGHYGQEVALQQSSCMPCGDDERVIQISFTKRTG